MEIITEKKNKLKPKTKNKILVLGFILIALAGIFGIGKKAEAQGTTEPLGTCVMRNSEGEEKPWEKKTSTQCDDMDGSPIYGTKVRWDAYPVDTDTTIGYCIAADGTVTETIESKCTGNWTTTKPNIGIIDPSGKVKTETEDDGADKSEFEKQINMGCDDLWNSSLSGCFLQIVYWIFHDIPAFFLYQMAYFFNVMISVSLDSALFSHTFVSEAWMVVRDLSNIFFILILLYIAVQIILDLGGHEAKKMIANVIIIALLINFSMFFTKVIIDSSNILALVFYNKLQVDTKVNGQPRDYASVAGEKDVAGGMVAAFDPTTKLQQPFFDEVKKISFVGRLIELWILIIASPFAFMSWTIPQMKRIGDWGWDGWLKRLITASFMAPAFMFFLYFIFLLISSNIFDVLVKPSAPGEKDAAGVIKMLLGIILPTMLILILLLKSVKLAKAGSGQFGETLTKGAATVGKLALGGLTAGAGALALGGTAMALRGTIGRGAANLAEGNRMRDWAAKSGFGKFISNRLSGVASSSFDARGVKIGGKNLAGMTGMNLGKAQEGGFAKAREEKVKREEEFANKRLDTSDYGIAKMTKGGMTTDQANRILGQMDAGGMQMTGVERLQHHAALTGGGMTLKDAKIAALHMNTTRRKEYADRKEKWTMSNRIAANKIRKDVKTQQEQQTMAQVMAALAKAQAAAASTTTPTTPPATGGGGHGGGAPRP